jgi:hypothetical protein
MAEWKTIRQAGFWGPDRKRIEAELDTEYGPGNWRIIHVWGKKGELVIPKTMAVELYGDAYFGFLRDNDQIRDYIRKEAKDVYVYPEQAVVTGQQTVPETLDYTIQEIEATHLQDIAIRRAFIRLGVWFEGNRLICVRGGSDGPIEKQLSPGKVPFHLPHMIYEPHLKGWWEDNSVACYYHSGKLLQAKGRK